MSGAADGSDFKEKLIGCVKKEVKQVMEEAVTKKFIHEESGSVTTLCSAVEACLIQGLRRRALGLFKTSSTTALLHKVAKHCPEAAYISKKVTDIENTDPNKRSSSSSDSTSKPPILKKNSSNSLSTTTPPTAPVVKYLWIRLALYEKRLSRIIDHLVTNATRYYEKDSLVADADYGSILSSLLVGPCALEYSRARTTDYFWTDPPADELVQRHRISSGHPTPPSCRRPILNFKRSLHTSSEDGSMGSYKSNSNAKVVESLHQNSKATLLYGKNNVLVLPKEKDKAMPGYLSLHQSLQSLTIKWTPNQLMNGYSGSDSAVTDKTSYWEYSLNINVDEIVYVHCHQARGGDTGGTVILVGQDGVQRPPIHFPEGGHMAAFLSCLETGLLPHGQLDPPLWSTRGIGRIFPWPLKNRRRPLPSVMEANDETPIDYVFRVVNKSNHEEFLASHSLMEVGRTSPRPRNQLSSSSTNDSSDCSNRSFSIDGTPSAEPPRVVQVNQDASPMIALACSSMRKQIISRAFYGWLAHVRHLSTVRRHLSGLVQSEITHDTDTEGGLTAERWRAFHNENGVVTDGEEIYRLVYFGGVAQEIRKEVWPYLLGHYKFNTTCDERKQTDEDTRHYYETKMSEWLAVEAIVRQHDKEKTAHAVAKLSSESGGDKPKPIEVDGEIENDVFEDNDISDLSDPEVDDTTDDTQGDKKCDEDSSNLNTDSEKPELSHQDSLKTPTSPKDLENLIDYNNGGGSSGAITNGGLELVIQENCFENKEEESNKSSPSTSSYVTVANDLQDFEEMKEARKIEMHAVIITDASIDVTSCVQNADEDKAPSELNTLSEEIQPISLDALQEPRSACVSPASSNGGIYTNDLLDTFGLNLHRIEKDVLRCDRNFTYFANENLDKLRNVICTYVWENLEVGYMQGMCDLLAPLLVIFDDESISYGCFRLLMKRMLLNFPGGCAMDMYFANMRSMIQILDPEMFERMHSYGDYTHFYFCYRWFLLDFKRELLYADIFAVWECIWTSKYVASKHFVLFLALALLETYRDVILANGMDFTDVIKFFNEMAERHNIASVLKLARSFVLQVQTLMVDD